LACKADINYLQYYKVITVTNTSGSTKNIEIDSIGNSLLADGVEPDPMSSGAYT
jgi:hypothetical protein